MILLWGLSGDDPFDGVVSALDKRDDVFVFDQRELPAARLSMDVRGPRVEGELVVGARSLRLEDVAAIYVRVYDAQRLPSVKQLDGAARDRAARLEELLWSFLELTTARVVMNRPSAMATNNSKPLQARLIAQSGFEVPTSLLTTDPEAARRFWGHHRDVIYKSISGARSVVARLSMEHLGRLDQVAHCPTQFQVFVPGTDFRVHVLGDRVFASRIVCDATDYRYAGRSGATVDVIPDALPPEVEEKARALARHLGLTITGLDLRRTPDGRWFCFEANPSPAFTYYERQTRQPMTEHVAELLASVSD